MSLAISDESKNSLSITNENKLSDYALDDLDISLDDMDEATLDLPRLPLINEDKNSLTITNESKT